ncbi:carbohydrate binding domain-containing protein [Saccharicrinis fermentans]|uniref:PKD domain-containing protein n=1 Tax=Saccharicrinis fermentans DSM 9555 = JCM 21142 TaxID=869213 RepID=W7YK95_9BACT|nr:hypothetical protein [Saccharicrinis fermentans]GAF02769.1 hypothetical protein JCM21142_41411 [Saccharicrinis fermentans DSM 9555 = JCM 21142]
MKNIKLLFVFSILAMMFACEADYEPLNEYSDVDWYTSSFSEETMVGLEKYLSFSDLSHNATSHSWSFSSESGCKFLTGRITRTDSTYYPFIDEDLDTISSDKTVHILFTKAGLQTIRLRNTFDDFVSFKGNDTLEAVYENGEWLIDTTFIVDVYDSIQSAFKVFKDDVEITAANVDFDQQVFLSDSASWPVQEVMAGEQLKFVDMTTVGRPTDVTWNVGGGTPSSSTDSAAVISFYRLGDYFARFTATRTGENIPAGYKMKYVPLKIRVIQSTLPFEVTGPLVELENEKIQISLTGEMQPFTDEEENFIVHVTNSSGFDQDIPVKAVTINDDQKNIIELELEDPIYNSDVITVSWAGGNIISLDERNLVAFSDLPVVMYKPNLIVSPGFEDGGTQWVTGSDHVASNMNEYSTTDPASGMYCMHLVTNEAVRNSVVNVTNFDVTKGVTYELSWKVKVTAASGGGYELRLNNVGVINDRYEGNWTAYGSADGVWKTVSKVLNYTGDATSLGVQILSYSVSETYWDDFSFSVYEARPVETKE